MLTSYTLLHRSPKGGRPAGRASAPCSARRGPGGAWRGRGPLSEPERAARPDELDQSGSWNRGPSARFSPISAPPRPSPGQAACDREATTALDVLGPRRPRQPGEPPNRQDSNPRPGRGRPAVRARRLLHCVAPRVTTPTPSRSGLSAGCTAVPARPAPPRPATGAYQTDPAGWPPRAAECSRAACPAKRGHTEPREAPREARVSTSASALTTPLQTFSDLHTAKALPTLQIGKFSDCTH